VLVYNPDMTSNQKLVIVSVILIIIGAILERKGVGTILNLLGWLGLVIALVSFINIKISERKEPKSKENKNKSQP
jgi:hypothetical protein